MQRDDHTLNLFGLIGFPLSHSFSKSYFTGKFEREGWKGYAYELFPISGIKALPQLLAQYPRLRGLNVTIPYKQAVLPFLDELDAEARAVGAVNTIRVDKGRLTGFNTDVYGFEKSLFGFLNRDADTATGLPEKALILGTGGASRAVAYVLEKGNISYKKVSRSKEKGDLQYREIDRQIIEEFNLIINTTPLGMSPHVDRCPDLPYQWLSGRNVLYDLVYNPEKTLFLEKGEQQQCRCKNGLEMLYLQAEKAWEIWQAGLTDISHTNY